MHAGLDRILNPVEAAELVDRVEAVGESAVIPDQLRHLDPAVLHIQSCQPIGRMRLDWCAGGDEHSGLGLYRVCTHEAAETVHMLQ